MPHQRGPAPVADRWFNKYTKEQWEEALRRARKGSSDVEISAAMRIGIRTVQKWRAQAGVTRKVGRPRGTINFACKTWRAVGEVFHLGITQAEAGRRWNVRPSALTSTIAYARSNNIAVPHPSAFGGSQ
jgi:hypothetical protein